MMRDQKLWTWHIVAGAVILVFLGLHMVTMHLEGVIEIASLNPERGERTQRGPIDWANVKARGDETFYMVTYVVLLGAALFHGLYGLRNILFELNPATWLQEGGHRGAAARWASGLFVFGTWAARRRPRAVAARHVRGRA